MRQIHTTGKSSTIIEELKIEHFSELFRLIDSDQDGQVSAQRMDLQQIDSSLLGSLGPILVQLEETGLTLNEDEFIDAAYRLYEVLPMLDKKALFNPKDSLSQNKVNRNNEKSSTTSRANKHQVFRILTKLLYSQESTQILRRSHHKIGSRMRTSQRYCIERRGSTNRE